MTCHDHRWPHICVCNNPIEIPRTTGWDYLLLAALLAFAAFCVVELTGCSVHRVVKPAIVREPLPTTRPKGSREKPRTHGWFGEVRR